MPRSATNKSSTSVKSENVSRAQMFSDFADYTSAHGFASIKRAMSWFSKFIWILAVIGLWSVMGYQIYYAIYKYFMYETTVSVTIKYSTEAEFPAITLCNLNPLKKYELKKMEYMNGYMSKLEMNGTEYEGWAGTPSESLLSTLTEEEKMKATVAWLMYSSEHLDLRTQSHQLKDMMLECTFQGRQCFPKNFTRWYHGTYGSCYTMFIAKDGLHPSLVGPAYGLSLSMFIQEDQYMPRVSPAAGFRLVVHPDEYPAFPEDLGFTVSTGQETSVSVKNVQIQRLPLPYDDTHCGDSIDHNPFIFKYEKKWNSVLAKQSQISSQPIQKSNFTNQACVKSCYSHSLYTACNCIDASVITSEDIKHLNLNYSVKACNMTDPEEVLCIHGTIIQMNQLKTCDQCSQPCYETAYQLMVTTALWPRDDYLQQIRNTWAKRLPDSGITTETPSVQVLRSQVAKIDVFFGDLNYELVVESPATDVWALASTVGGTLGLYGGLSFLTMLEFTELFARVAIKRRAKN